MVSIEPESGSSSSASEGEVAEEAEDQATGVAQRVRFVDEADYDIQYFDAERATKRRSGRSRRKHARLGFNSSLLCRRLAMFVSFVSCKGVQDELLFTMEQLPKQKAGYSREVALARCRLHPGAL